MDTETLMVPVGGWQRCLSEDKQGHHLRSLHNYLAQKRAELRRALDTGAAPEKYAVLEKLLAAVDAADSVATTFWEKRNKI